MALVCLFPDAQAWKEKSNNTDRHQPWETRAGKKKKHRRLQCCRLMQQWKHNKTANSESESRISENTRKEEESKKHWPEFPILAMSLCVSQSNGWFMARIVKCCNWPPCLLWVWKWEQEWSRDVSGLSWTFCQCRKVLRARGEGCKK